MMRGGPIDTDIVLVGGGHAHVHVLTAFAMRPLPGVRLTLVTRDLMTPYSGMLPGVIAGLYTSEQAHIDLVRLAAATGTRLIHAEAIGLDRANKRVLLAGRAAVAYDLVSIDVGIAPALAAIAGAAEHAIAVKPIGSFLSKFNDLLGALPAAGRPAKDRGGRRRRRRRRIAAVGAHAAVCADAARHADLSFALVTDGEILATHNQQVRAAFRRVLAARGVALHEHRTRARDHGAARSNWPTAKLLAADAVLVTTDAAPPSWFRGTGLDLDAKGFLAVAPTLQVDQRSGRVRGRRLRGAGRAPREKAGVYAVRAGPPLAENLRRRARGATVESLAAATPAIWR